MGKALRHTSRRLPEREALVFAQDGTRVTYAEYDALVDEVARGLLALDIGIGDPVALWSTNRLEWVLLHLATARIGAVLVTVNPAYRGRELAYALLQSDARALFLVDRFKSSDYFGIAGETVGELAASTPGGLRSEEFPELRWVVALGGRPAPGMVGWNEMLERGQRIEPSTLERREGELEDSDAINLQYTSGTTGSPKGVLLSHHNLLLNATYVGDGQRLSEADRVCVPVPFYHCFGCVIGTLCCMVHGSTMLVPAEHFDAERTLACLERESATAVYGVPTMFIALLEDDSLPARALPALRTGVMAGSPCPVELVNRVREEMGAEELTIAYGLTEASPTVTQTPIDDPVELRVSTVGRPIPGVEVKIVDPRTGDELPDGTPGELCCRGHNVMIGYYEMPEATARAIDPDGWLHTGDLAVRGVDGRYRITGRLKDMVIRGGENVYPREIEEFLYTHPAVEDVQVVGVPDLRFGEEICAFIRRRRGSRATAEEIRDFCRDGLAHFKVPRYVRFVEEFPMTVTGKVQKYRLRERAIRELGLEDDA